jgi:hypothetical protein
MGAGKGTATSSLAGLVATVVSISLLHRHPPPPIQFLHDLQNKPLTSFAILHDPENKGDNLQDLENAGVMVCLEL